MKALRSLALLLCVFLASPLAFTQPVALVYDGAGACAEQCVDAAADAARNAGFSVRYINAHTWSEALFKGAAVWVQPGGKSHVVAATLTESQKNRIRRFVASGGGYAGFCAGGFFASASYLGNEKNPAPVPMLGLVPLQTDVFDNPLDADILAIDWLGATHYFYWEGGPYFVPPPSPLAGIELIGHYSNGQIAALRTTYGTGRVFVTGFHPEAPASWRSYYKLVDPDGLDVQFASEMIDWAASKGR